MDVALEHDRLTHVEAQERAATISDVHYVIHLDFEANAKTYQGECVIHFLREGLEATFLDFTGSSIEHFEINGKEFEPEWHDNRLSLPADLLAAQNEIRVRYSNTYNHTGEGLHQFVDPVDDAEYLYTQFEPFGAHRMFPCFDQPDLKATFTLSTTSPSEWEVLTGSLVVSSEKESDGRIRRLFEETVPISTYLVSLVGGPYQSVKSEHNGVPLGLYCRASLMEHLDPEELFDFTKWGLDYFEDFFGHPYPFTKYDQIFVPEFNAGAMENIGNVTFNESYIFRDPPTENQRLRRAETLLHEMAHQWFGNLVTMEWFSDLWLNESFATFMSFQALEALGEYPNSWLHFQADMKRWAYTQDQLPTTHRIADDIPSTEETFLNFDGITYGKGSAALRQLVASVGEEALRKGMKAYFEQHAFGNATLTDFLAAVQLGSGMELSDWSQAWLETPSLNTLAADWEAVEGKISSMQLIQTAPPDYPTMRPHYVEVASVVEGEDGLEVTVHPARIESAAAEVPDLVGKPQPSLVFPNYRDLTFAKIKLDPVSLDFAERRLDEIGDDLFRQLLWAALWDMVRDQHFSSLDYLRLVEEKLPAESNLQIVKLATDTASGAVSRYVPEESRVAAGSSFVAAALDAATEGPSADGRVLWLRALLRVVETRDDLESVAALVDGDGSGAVAIDQDMRWALAARWAAAGFEDAAERAAREFERDPSDRGQRAMITIDVAKPDEEAKAEAWTRIHADGYGSLYLDKAAMAGFQWPGQRALLEPYVDRYFSGLEASFTAREHEAAWAYFMGLMPGHRVDAEALGLAKETLAGVSDSAPLERMLIESIDGLERAIACRAYAAAK